MEKLNINTNTYHLSGFLQLPRRFKINHNTYRFQYMCMYVFFFDTSFLQYKLHPTINSVYTYLQHAAST